MIMRYQGTDILSAAVVGQNVLSPFALSRVFCREGSAYRRVSGVRKWCADDFFRYHAFRVLLFFFSGQDTGLVYAGESS